VEENEAVRYRLSSMTKSNFSFWILVVGVVLCSCAKNESVPSPLNSPFGKWDIYSIQYNDEKVFDEMVIYESQLLESQGLKVKSYLEITKKEFKTVTECTVIGGPTIKAESYYKDFKFEDSLAFFNNDIETVKIPLNL